MTTIPMGDKSIPEDLAIIRQMRMYIRAAQEEFIDANVDGGCGFNRRKLIDSGEEIIATINDRYGWKLYKLDRDKGA